MATCSHPSRRPLFSARDYITGDPFTVERCTSCGLMLTAPAPDDLSPYYPAAYHGGASRYGRTLEALLQRLYARRAAAIEQQSGVTRGLALDIGCGRGWLLDALRRRGWTVEGTELTEESARYARETLGLHVETGEDAVKRLPDDRYDVVILWHVLEHIARPDELLAQVARLLRPGGTLLVAVPNAGSPEARWGRDRWFHLDVPRHLIHFTPSTLRAALRDAGLTPFREEYAAPEYDAFSFVQTALNRLGVRHNLLYNVIRSRSARMLGNALPARGLAVTLLLAPVLGAVSLLWTPLAAATGRGATVAIYARKPRAVGAERPESP